MAHQQGYPMLFSSQVRADANKANVKTIGSLTERVAAVEEDAACAKADIQTLQTDLLATDTRLEEVESKVEALEEAGAGAARAALAVNPADDLTADEVGLLQKIAVDAPSNASSGNRAFVAGSTASVASGDFSAVIASTGAQALGSNTVVINATDFSIAQDDTTVLLCQPITPADEAGVHTTKALQLVTGNSSALTIAAGQIATPESGEMCPALVSVPGPEIGTTGTFEVRRVPKVLYTITSGTFLNSEEDPVDQGNVISSASATSTPTPNRPVYAWCNPHAPAELAGVLFGPEGTGALALPNVAGALAGGEYVEPAPKGTFRFAKTKWQGKQSVMPGKWKNWMITELRACATNAPVGSFLGSGGPIVDADKEDAPPNFGCVDQVLRYGITGAALDEKCRYLMRCGADIAWFNRWMALGPKAYHAAFGVLRPQPCPKVACLIAEGNAGTAQVAFGTSSATEPATRALLAVDKDAEAIAFAVATAAVNTNVQIEYLDAAGAPASNVSDAVQVQVTWNRQGWAAWFCLPYLQFCCGIVVGPNGVPLGLLEASDECVEPDYDFLAGLDATKLALSPAAFQRQTIVSSDGTETVCIPAITTELCDDDQPLVTTLPNLAAVVSLTNRVPRIARVKVTAPDGTVTEDCAFQFLLFPELCFDVSSQLRGTCMQTVHLPACKETVVKLDFLGTINRGPLRGTRRPKISKFFGSQTGATPVGAGTLSYLTGEVTFVVHGDDDETPTIISQHVAQSAANPNLPHEFALQNNATLNVTSFVWQQPPVGAAPGLHQHSGLQAHNPIPPSTSLSHLSTTFATAAEVGSWKTAVVPIPPSTTNSHANTALIHLVQRKTPTGTVAVDVCLSLTVMSNWFDATSHPATAVPKVDLWLNTTAQLQALISDCPAIGEESTSQLMYLPEDKPVISDELEVPGYNLCVPRSLVDSICISESTCSAKPCQCPGGAAAGR